MTDLEFQLLSLLRDIVSYENSCPALFLDRADKLIATHEPARKAHAESALHYSAEEEEEEIDDIHAQELEDELLAAQKDRYGYDDRDYGDR